MALCYGCGAHQPPTLTALRGTLDAVETKTAEQWARLGWLHYLEGAPTKAETAFYRAPAHPLAALGRARLSQDQLKPRITLAEAAVAARATGRVGLIGRLWAEDAAEKVRDGETLLGTALGPMGTRRKATPALGSTAVISYLPHLDLVRLRDHPPEVIGPRRIHALGREWPMNAAPKPNPGRLVLSRWDVPDGPIHLEVRGGGAMIAWRGDRLIASTARTRFPARRARFSAEGGGPLILAWAGDTHPKVWLWTEPAPPLLLDQDPLNAFLAIEHALLDGDAEWANRALASTPATAAFAVQRARAKRISPGIPRRQRWDEAHGEWLEAQSISPARAALALAQIEQLRGTHQKARERLSTLAALTPTSAAVHRALGQSFAAIGATDNALAALETAALHSRNPCGLLDERVQLVGNGTRRAREALIGDLIKCGRHEDAAAQYLDQDRPMRAAEVLADAGKGPALERLRAKVDIALGAVDAGRARLSLLGTAATPQDRLLSTDLRLAEGDAARADVVEAYIDAEPTAREALRFAATHPEWSAFATLRLDTDTAIAGYEAETPMKGSAVRVLDHSALIFLGGDESLRWVHEILAIRSREAAENFGELGLPAEAHPIAVFTRKADGRRLYAEDSPEKDTLSLPDLAVGDYVVAVYLEPGDNGYLYDTGMVSPRVFFRGVDLPIFHQRFEVYGPDEAPLIVETKNLAPVPQAVQLEGRSGWRFDARSVPLRDAEPRPVPPSHWLPWARVGRGVDFYEGLRFLRNQHAGARLWTDRFEEWVRPHWRGNDLATRLDTLASAVLGAVDGADGIAGRDATFAVESGVGNRALVTSVALEAMGVPHRLVLARPRVHDGGGTFSQPTDFVYPLIQMADGAWVDPSQPGATMGFIPFIFLGGDAVSLWPTDDRDEPIALPTRRPSGDAREIEVDAHWRADGVIEGRVHDTLWGQEAIVIGRYLSRLEEEVKPRLVERLISGVFGGARVDELEITRRGGRLTLEYTFEAQGGEEMTVGLFPVRPGQRFAPLAQRTLPLYVDLPVAQTLRLRLTSARDFHTDGGAVRHAHEGDAYLFVRDIDADDDEVEVESALHIRGGVIEPRSYDAFGRWARRVDGAEQLRLTRRP